MQKNITRILTLLVLLTLIPLAAEAQKIITYEAGLGRRDKRNPDTWILCREVRAEHEGMVLYADSALMNTTHNDFTAFNDIEIILSDTTFIYGNELYYDGNSRVVDIWDDTVIFIDGATILKTDHLSFDRKTNKAFYNTWGHTTNAGDTLDSQIGIYDATQREVLIYDRVVLRDSASRLETDTLLYHVGTETADFRSPTYIFSDTTTIYSERGSYFTKQRYALSTKSSFVKTGGRTLTCDTLHYFENDECGKAQGNVVLFDSLNNVTCMGHYGETNQKTRSSFVTGGAMVTYVKDNDTLFMHADTIHVTNNKSNDVERIRAHYGVRLFRHDVQAICDSAHFMVPDSNLFLHHNPTLWQNAQQCTADTIVLHTTSNGVRQADLNGHCFVIERIDPEKYNQIKGNNARVHFADNDPVYADILGNAEMVYYITEEIPGKGTAIIGVNVGVGSDMRIYFQRREPNRVVTYRDPDMRTYPLSMLPSEKKRLEGFSWRDEQRPHSKEEIFK
ncbi:MAG: OstA-like protein [Bacteroidales bacterium]|nr:OstA-like protein [Bacteroidales bacterium]